MPERQLVDRVRAIARIDLAPVDAQPSIARVVVATAASVAASLLADAALVKLGTWMFPSTTRAFSHFRLSDYVPLTVIGVTAAGLAWSIVTRLTSSPRWLFARVAVVVTVALWLPDGWLLLKGEPGKAVGVLMLMHLAIAVLAYNVLVRGAPAGQAVVPATAGLPATVVRPATVGVRATVRLGFIAMVAGTVIEFGLGMVGLLLVPLGRPSGWLPTKGDPLYIAHAVVGAALAAGGVLLLVRATRGGRLERIGAWIGAVGLAIGAGGGFLAVYHPARLAGMGLMLVGAVAAGFGYLIPVVA